LREVVHCDKTYVALFVSLVAWLLRLGAIGSGRWERSTRHGHLLAAQLLVRVSGC
jgi:hypothetical protein